MKMKVMLEGVITSNSAVNKVLLRGLLLLYHLLREERFHTIDSVDTLCGSNLIRVQNER